MMLELTNLVGLGVTPPNEGSAHRYWRLYITTVVPMGSMDLCAIQEFELTDTVGGKTLANIPANGYAENYTNPNYPSYAFDNAAGWWLSQMYVPHWLAYDFGAPQAVAEFSIVYPGATYGGGWSPTEFKLQYSDDNASWYDATSLKTASWGSITERKSFSV